MKHYGFRGVSGTKQAMSPKLYDAISEKFRNLWGDYAGWAHSVRFFYYRGGCTNCNLQVLFTADLKVFSDYGLATPSPSPIKATTFSLGSDPYLSVPNHSQLKRKAKQIKSQSVLGQKSASYTDTSCVEPSSIAERIKKRRQ